MNQRAIFLKEFRGETIGIVTDHSSLDEQFQNEVLRPILKLQNDLFVVAFLNYMKKNKIVFKTYTFEKKMAMIENAIQKDIKFRNVFKGIIIGLFTIDEYSLYIKNSYNLNKRMIALLIERLKSQVQLFEKESI